MMLAYLLLWSHTLAHIFEQRLNLLASPDLLPKLANIKRGIEKEGLRANLSGELAKSPHPKSLGSALTHACITTDYSESLLEFITPTIQSPEEVISYLKDIHKFVYSRLEDEIIWVASMPCRLGGEENIPIAYYGSSNTGTLKFVYRVGLEHRYGKTMQTIAGIHYNFSLPESFWPTYKTLISDDGDISNFQTEQYFSLIRNFRRYSWLILYLFGASPALCKTFLEGKEHQLKTQGKTLLAPYATSLRMGDLGYQSNAQQDLNICYNNLDNYVSTLGAAMKTAHPAYEEIGVLKDGEYRQLNTSVLQIENEYYSDIRPKRVAGSSEKPLQVLAEKGIEYIEVRNLDINPFIPAGISAEQVRFMDCFLLYCLLEDSPDINDDECERLSDNKQRIVNRGREPGLTLSKNNQEVTLQVWGGEILDKITSIAKLMDQAFGGEDFLAAIELQKEKLSDTAKTPSAQTIHELETKSQSFFEFGLEHSLAQKEYFSNYEANADRLAYFEGLTQSSLDQQKEIEAADTLPFADFLEQYIKS